MTCILNGVGNFAVVERISQEIPEKTGVAISISTGIAAFLAFPIGIASLWFEYTPTVLCALALAYSGLYARKPAPLRSQSIFHLPAEDRDIIDPSRGLSYNL